MSDLRSWAEKSGAQFARFCNEAIIPDLENEWKKREESLQQELKLTEDHQRILSVHINNEVIKNAELTGENADLKRQLQRQIYGAESSEEMANMEGTVSVDEYRALSERFKDLNKQYQEAIQKAKYLEKKNAAVMQKNREMKESVRAWQEYCDRHIGKQKPKTEPKVEEDLTRFISRPEQVRHLGASSPKYSDASTPRPASAVSSPTPFAPGHLETPPARSSDHERGSSRKPVYHVEQTTPRNEAELLAIGQRPTASVISGDPIEDLNAGKETHVQSGFDAERITSSQTTEDEAPQKSPATDQVFDENDDDMPQFVSERSLKRKRETAKASNFKVYTDQSSDGTPSKPFKVKEEQDSSPPLAANTGQLSRTDTFDLDELGPGIVPATTRRRQTIRGTNSIHSNQTGQLLRHQRSNSAPFVKDEIDGEEQEIETDDDCHRHDQDRHEMELQTVSEPSGSFISEPNTALQPLDPNVVSNISEDPPRKRQHREQFRNKQKFEALAETGDISSTSNDTRKNREPRGLLRETINREVQSRYTKTPTKKTPTTCTPKSAPPRTNHAPQRQQLLQTPSSSSSRPNPQTEPRPDNRPIWQFGTKPGLIPTDPSRSTSKPSPSTTNPQRLRDKPLPSLRLSDFKPNPAYNPAYTNAFSETVRKRHDRACLPGCTKPSCCGSTFRLIAETLAPLSAAQEEALLQDYLGDAYDDMGLTQMRGEERAELVLQARTRKVAAEAGKHRSAYEDRNTPPGYWRVDFPSTQEEEEDQRKAQERERERVEERWIEARRGGGRYVFRDE
ncbi:hypothetical protein BS50DRAFT_620712 [Corynespora cassiicola Philippines]|uniref:DNA endonuclease activator Ctp1 C-terminal domain-containing protein n=1 Tax=Corynespora cassiicola Philippines TaxID=1448308 RepID=A0A2T2NSY3_CORCC|nr:hypothetical protein BS50DRAFT_620712 [Corynespora cassiicola Philippines]